MKIYRGPASQPFAFDSLTHDLVDNVGPEQLEEALKNIGKRNDNLGTFGTFSFRINKDAPERRSICTAQFEDSDLIAILRGIAVRLQCQQSALSEIVKIIQDPSVPEPLKITKIILIMVNYGCYQR